MGKHRQDLGRNTTTRRDERRLRVEGDPPYSTMGDDRDRHGRVGCGSCGREGDGCLGWHSMGVR